MNGKQRIKLIVLDLVERMRLPQDIKIIRNGEVLYTGSVRGTRKELLNEKVNAIYTDHYSFYIYIIIE